ncbi:MAG: shikimate dehydrogenase family protein [Candidatus Limnocylindria bacterium]
MSRVVLLGEGIGYSASPAMHNAAFTALGLPHRYELANVPASDLAARVAGLRADDALGANVTKPHKVAVCILADDRSPEVERLGAANTLVRRDGRLTAHNTDLAALAAELVRVAPRPGRRAVILGAGGASLAARAALADAGWTDVVAVTRERWAQMPALLDGADLLVNATPIGTAGSATDGESPIRESSLRPDLAVLDLVYRPSPTRMVREARAAGAAAISGAGMLLRQAAASFLLWTGQEAPLDVMRDALHDELGPRTDA